MSRYVDAEYIKAVMLNDRLMQGNAEFTLYAQQVETQVNALPSIEIIRCGECKWLRYCETEEMELTLDCDHPDGGGIPRSEEWFCADGERKGQV
jgi:hypothetical protein